MVRDSGHMYSRSKIIESLPRAHIVKTMSRAHTLEALAASFLWNRGLISEARPFDEDTCLF